MSIHSTFSCLGKASKLLWMVYVYIDDTWHLYYSTVEPPNNWYLGDNNYYTNSAMCVVNVSGNAVFVSSNAEVHVNPFH